MVDEELGELTTGERLMVGRRRLGQNQREAAAEWGVALSRYSLWERDAAVHDGPAVLSEPLAAHERCLLYRRRAGFTQAKVAQEMGVCRWWLNQMERGEIDCTNLVQYWEC